MAEYKVPQDVEADDKLLGPFSFRQFVYLLIAGGLVALAIFLFQIFPLLAIIPVPFIALLAILALPIKKDQPMETYLAAVISYYLKPHNRYWNPGQRESTIQITAPKVAEVPRARNISEEEASHRLSFLANLIDSGGQTITNTSPMRDDLYAEATTAEDMFDNYNSPDINQRILDEQTSRHSEVINKMRSAIAEAEKPTTTPTIQRHYFAENPTPTTSDTVIQPSIPVAPHPHTQPTKTTITKPPKSSIIDLAQNTEYSVSTISKEANRINKKHNDEVYISLR